MVSGRAARGRYFLDRDGVINRAIVRDGRPYPPPTLADLESCRACRKALARLRAGGLPDVVVTNQPDVATRQDAQASSTRCTTPARDAAARRDQGLAHVDAEAATAASRGRECCSGGDEWRIDLPQSFMVGDRWRDIEAGRAAGCRRS